MAEPNENHVSALASSSDGGLGSENVVVSIASSSSSSCQLTQKRAVAGSTTMRPSAGNEADGAMYTVPRRARIGRIVGIRRSALLIHATQRAPDARLKDDRWHGGCGERPRCATRATRSRRPATKPAS
jgi:hypothetical protein